MAAPRLTNEQHDAVLKSPVGQYLDRLVREDAAKNGGFSLGGGGNIIQQLWEAFHAGDAHGHN
jgi:hypothetical protein